MNEAVCKFISDAIYNGRLHPQADILNQKIVLHTDAHPELITAGIRFIPMNHEGCSRKSEEEAKKVKELYQSLLKQSYIDRHGVKRPITSENILIVAPYNMQVNLLKQTLPPRARVGTVDKFQGQEAEAVIISMTTSSEEDLPRYMEFLYAKIG